MGEVGKIHILDEGLDEIGDVTCIHMSQKNTISGCFPTFFFFVKITSAPNHPEIWPVEM